MSSTDNLPIINFDPNFYINIRREAIELLNKCDSENALILLTETYLGLDNKLRKAYNRNAPKEEIETMFHFLMELGNLMAPLLCQRGDFNSCLTGIVNRMMIGAQLDIYKKEAVLMSITILQGLTTVEILSSQLPQDDAFYVEHVPVVLSYFASILYAMYQEVGQNLENSDIIYQKLLEYKHLNAIQADKVSTPNGMANPLKPLPILSDLIGRVMALGWIELE